MSSYHVHLKPHWLQQLCPLLLPPTKRCTMRYTSNALNRLPVQHEMWGKKSSLNKVLLKASFVQQHQNIETLRSNLSSCPWQWEPLHLMVKCWMSRHAFFESLKRKCWKGKGTYPSSVEIQHLLAFSHVSRKVRWGSHMSSLPGTFSLHTAVRTLGLAVGA